MIATTWGLLGPEKLSSDRRARSLGLTTAVRAFNELAVPGLGNVFFGKQLFLSLLGVAVASAARARGARKVGNIETANAIEALACWIGLSSSDWASDPRLRGRVKLEKDKNQTFRFTELRRPSYYVAHPMREATSPALLDLKLVEPTGRLFNSFECSQRGVEFLELAIGGQRPGHKSFIDYLAEWVLGGESYSPVIDDVISPNVEMIEPARKQLRSLLNENDRRRNLLVWMKAINGSATSKIGWHNKPPEIDEAHWRDLHVGSMFFAARDAALRLLLQLERQVSNSSYRDFDLTNKLSAEVTDALEGLRAAANEFLSQAYDPTPDHMATRFCRECSTDNAADILKSLIERDGRILVMRDGKVHVRGAFHGRPIDIAEVSGNTDDGSEADLVKKVEWPEGISRRVNNFYFLDLDLNGQWPVERG